MSSIAVSLSSYLLCISISVVIQWLLLKMNVWTCETSSLSFISFQKCVTNSLCLSPQFLGSWFGIITRSADHSDLEALTGPKHYLKSFHYPWQEPRICGEKMRKVILVAYWGSRAPVKLYRGGTGLACRSVKDGGWDGGESQDLLVKTYVLQITMNENKPVNQGSQKLKYKRKREGEVYTGSKQLRSEGFSWWTSLLLGTDCTLQRDSTPPRLSTAECELKQPENSLCSEEN